MNVFETAKAIDALDFSIAKLGINFKRSGSSNCAKSPFRSDERTASFFYKEGLFNDFGGDFKGDIINLVSELKHMTPVEAAKFICDSVGASYDVKEEYKKIDLSVFNSYKIELSKNIFDYLPHLKKIFIKFDGIAKNNLLKFIGWDKDQDSLVIASYDEVGEIVNIKHRTKKGFEGKWISASGGKSVLFPHSSFIKDGVVLTEGEKDCLNLNSLGVNAITLGGVSNSYEKYKIYFANLQRVYICYDYDLAGIKNTLAKAKDLYSYGVKEVYFFDWREIAVNTLNKKYDISDYLFTYEFKWEEFKSKATFIPNNSLNRDFEYELIKLDIATTKTKTKKEQYTLQEFQNKLAINMNVYEDGKIRMWAEAKRSMIKNVLSELKSIELADDKEKIQVVSALEDISKELAFFKVEKHVGVSRYIKKECERLGITIARNENSILFFNGKYYEAWDDKDFTTFYLNFLSQKIIEINDSENIKTRIYTTLKDFLYKLPDTNTSLINTLNCVIDIDNQKTLQHSDKYNFTYVLNFKYDREATCPLFDKYLESTLPDVTLQQSVLEYIAYCIMPDYEHQKFLLLEGKGSNGKSVLMKIIKAMFEEKSVGAVNIYEGHHLDGLIGKKINITEDKTLEDMKDNEIDYIKKIVDNSSYDINVKFKDITTMRNSPKLIISTNNLPKNTDFSFTRRMLLIPFEQKFSIDAKDERYKTITKLADKIIENELAGIFNKVVKAYQNLKCRGRFIKSNTSENALTNFTIEHNSAYRFASEHCEIDENSYITIQNIYNTYRVWCETEGIKQKSKIVFGKDISEFLNIKSEVMRIEGKNERVYKGIKII